MALATYELSFLDNTDQDPAAKMTVYHDQLTAGTIAGFAAAASAFKTKMAAIILSTIASEKFVQYNNSLSTVRPVSTAAQNENRWLIRSVDTDGNRYRHFLPGADLSLLASGSEFLDITTILGPGNEFAAEWNTFVKSKAGNSSTISSMQFVGHR
jgi:hypothetical protein